MIAAALGVLVLIAVADRALPDGAPDGFLNPGADAAGAGFQGAQASIALGSGGIFGVGLGESVQKAFYLPEAHTDMIAAVIGEELGLVGIIGARRPLHAVRLRRLPDRPARPRPLRSPARRRPDGDDPGPGDRSTSSRSSASRR